ncbi:hypothetical protein ABNF65_23245 [Paenibacillus larvae]
MKEKNPIRHIGYLYKHFGQIQRVSRKTKKAILGRKLNKREMKKRLANVVVSKNKYPMEATISDRFCPKCGCEKTRSTENMAGYPDLWVRVYCLRCGFLVEQADNSPFYHALEYPEYDYQLPW